MARLRGKKVAVLGLGQMGEILVRGFFRNGILSPKQITATVHRSERAEDLSLDLKIEVTTDNPAAVKDSDIVLLCVKPNTVATVLDEIRPAMSPNTLFISIAASVSSTDLEDRLPKSTPVIRAMPNTPSAVCCGVTALSRGSRVSNAQMKLATLLFQAVGTTVELDEKHMDAVTGLSASGPAFIYVILESLAEAGVKVGLPRDVATLLAAETTRGAATIALETGQHPALLKDAVTTPAGCTIDGILELEEGKLRVTLIKAVVKATQRAKGLLVE